MSPSAERYTDPALPTVRPPQQQVQRVFEQPTAPQQIVVVPPANPPQPEKIYVYLPPEQRRKEPDASPRSDVYVEPPRAHARPEAKRAPIDPGTKKVPPGEQKKFAEPTKNNAPTIPKELPSPIVGELFTPPPVAPQAAMEPYKKRGKVGRERDYQKVRKVILYKVKIGRYQPDLSKDMRDYYDHWYFTKPNKRRDGTDYERHVRAYNRCQAWLAE